jgi:hypothetical protein
LIRKAHLSFQRRCAKNDLELLSAIQTSNTKMSTKNSLCKACYTLWAKQWLTKFSESREVTTQTTIVKQVHKYKLRVLCEIKIALQTYWKFFFFFICCRYHSSWNTNRKIKILDFKYIKNFISYHSCLMLCH